MSTQLVDNPAALRLFLTEDIYAIKNELPAVKVQTNAGCANRWANPEAAEKKLQKQTDAGQAEENFQPQAKEWDFQFLGENQKKVLILVNDAQNEVSTTQGLEVLRKIVRKLGLSGKDFALVNYARYKGAAFADFKQFFDCRLLLSFGVDCACLQLPQSNLHALVTYRQVKIVITQRVDILDDDHETLLWAGLKQLIE